MPVQAGKTAADSAGQDEHRNIAVRPGRLRSDYGNIRIGLHALDAIFRMALRGGSNNYDNRFAILFRPVPRYLGAEKEKHPGSCTFGRTTLWKRGWLSGMIRLYINSMNFHNHIKGIVDSIFTANEFPKVPFKEIYVRAGEGGTPATSNPEYYVNGTIPFIKIDDLQNKYIKTNKDCITELGLQKSSAWIVPANSIIYSNGATIGAISINLFPVCTKQGILGVVPKADINVEFLYYFMTSTAFTKAVERIVTEGTMRTAYLKDINHIPCPVPCSVKQDEIAKLLSTLSEKLENEVIFQMKLQKQKEFLLSQMFI